MIMRQLTRIETGKPGDAKEWAVCAYMGVSREKHDSGAYDKDSDCNCGELHISVKSSAFSLMSGSLCEGREDFDGIWKVYERNTHSNRFAYVSHDFVMFLMDIHEFKKFVYSFCRVEHESKSHGGAAKIRCRKESAKMLKWLTDMVTA